jgi:TRAP transporter TAXI family solute receptor
MHTIAVMRPAVASRGTRVDTLPAMIRREFLTALPPVLLAGCGKNRAARKHRLSIAAGLTGGVYYVYGGGIAKVASESIPGLEVTAEATSGSIDNLKFIHAGKADIGFTLADTLDDAIKGQGAFREMGALKIRSLAVLYANLTQVVAFSGNGMRTLGDLRGRVVSVGAPGSGTETVAVRVLEAAGVDPQTGIRRQGLGVSTSADALKDGKLDAFFWSSGVPAGALLDLAATPGKQMMLLENASTLPELQRRFGTLYAAGTIPKTAYPGLEADVAVVAVSNVLVVSEALDETFAYELTRMLFVKQAELAAIHPEAGRLSLASAVAGSPAPFHPGAIRFYKEKGAWPQ